jgi:hypothetical protein
MDDTIKLPVWADEIRSLYMSDAANQFIVSGNVNDKITLPTGTLGTLEDFLLKALLVPFDVVLVYDIGRGITCPKGQKHFNSDNAELPSTPRHAVEAITEYLNYIANNNALNKVGRHVAVVIRDAQLIVPAAGQPTLDQHATASLIRDWASRSEYLRNGFATFLVTENVNDLHPLLATSDRAARITIPLPSGDDLKQYLRSVAGTYFKALRTFGDAATVGEQLVGVTLAEVEKMLKLRHHDDKPLSMGDLVKIKKQIIEKQADGLIEFIESDKNFDWVLGHEEQKKALRNQLALWKQDDLRAIPMGYLLAAPVGVGKTFFIECLAGEAGYPVIRVKNFRTKWVGETESKQEKIIRLIRAIGRCFVFFDEADQTLGKRDGGDGDSGLSGRVYSAWAQEMSNSKNRGKIVWILASSRADLIEVDLKRPGRIDVSAPLFPSGTDEEAFALLAGMLKREGIELPPDAFDRLRMSKRDDVMRNLIPQWLTAGAAESLAKRVYLETKSPHPCVEGDAFAILEDCLWDYEPPVPLSKLKEQIIIAANNCTDTSFIPAPFKAFRSH